MDKNELLLEISGLLDKKFDVFETRIEDKFNVRFDELEQKIDSVEARLSHKIDTVESRLDKKIDDTASVLNKKIDDTASVLNKKIDDQVSKLEEQIRYGDIILENEVVPRIKNLEECYTSTYKRYRDGILKLDSIEANLQIHASVIQSHSVRLDTLEERI